MDETDTTSVSKWQDASTYTGIASTAAGVLATFGIVSADQTSLIIAAVAGFAGGVIALCKLIRSFKKE